MPEKLPFNFILDYLDPLDITVKSMFGMFAFYSGKRIVLMLRQRNVNPERNGIWLAINKEHRENLVTEFPSLTPISGLHKKSQIDEWLLLPSSSNDFETSAITICRLIAKGDQRIGHIPKSQRTT